jgi:hypothetical protein
VKEDEEQEKGKEDEKEQEKVKEKEDKDEEDLGEGGNSMLMYVSRMCLNGSQELLNTILWSRLFTRDIILGLRDQKISWRTSKYRSFHTVFAE